MGSEIHLPLPLHVKGLSNLYNLSLFINIIFDFETLHFSAGTISILFFIPAKEMEFVPYSDHRDIVIPLSWIDLIYNLHNPYINTQPRCISSINHAVQQGEEKNSSPREEQPPWALVLAGADQRGHSFEENGSGGPGGHLVEHKPAYTLVEKVSNEALPPGWGGWCFPFIHC